MALFRRKIREPDAAKAAVVEGDLRTDTILHHFGWGWSSAYGELYRKQPAVRTVVDFLAQNIGQLNPKVYVKQGATDRVEADAHPLAVLLNHPNPQTSRARFIRDTVADKAIYDRAYWWKDRYPEPTAIVRISPERIRREIVTNMDGSTTIKYRQPNGVEIPRNRLVIFSGYSPNADWNDEDGVSPLETLRMTLEEEWQAQAHRRSFWKNSARREGVIERPLEAPAWGDEARQRFRNDWENTMSGPGNGGRTAVLEEGMHLNGDSFSPKESDYIEGRRLTFEEVCRQYRVAPKLFGVGDTQNANVEAFHRQLYQDTLGPWLRELQDEIELQLLPDFGKQPDMATIYVEFNFQEKLKGSFEEQARALTTAVGVPYLSVNRALAMLNEPRVDDPDFDVPVKPLNVLYGGQPAPTIPTEVPAPKRVDKKSAPAGAVRRRNEAAEQHTELFRRYFRAQQKAFHLKADGFDMERWNAKLTGELYAARVALAGKTGKLAARQMRGVYDPERTLNFLQESARSEAESVNEQTASALDDSDDPDSVFDIATSSRAARLGLSTATAIIGFARHEAAVQSSQADGRTRQKTWVVTSDKSRHPELDGETVDFDQTFSNGLQWPGDSSSGDAEDVAGCQCLLDIN